MLAKRPPMGFNTWNTFGGDINEEIIFKTADKMVELGLRDAGYEYLVIDDCWSEMERDPETDRLVPDHIKFPHGMKYVADYVHSKGLKFGMYSDAGVYTCAMYPASFDREYLDAKTFAEWGADYLKYDYGNKPDDIRGDVLYRRMALALRQSGRDIVFSACQWGCDEPHQWIRSAGADLYRSTGDILDSFESMKKIALSQIDKLCCAGPGLWNDTDMLTVGMHGNGNVGRGGCTDMEYRTEFALWCMIQSPLMIGADLRKLDETSLALLKNPYLIRINQDEDGRPPYVLHGAVDEENFTLCKLLTDNEIAILMVNLTERTIKMRFLMEDMGIPVHTRLGLAMTDAYTGENLGVKREIFFKDIAPHDSACYLCRIK